MVLSLSVGQRTDAWSAIGTLTQPPETDDLFAAWIVHQDLTQPISYTIFPGTTLESFRKRAKIFVLFLFRTMNISRQSLMQTVGQFTQFSGTLAAVRYDARHPLAKRFASVTASGTVALMLHLRAGNLTVSDLCRSLSIVDISIQNFMVRL